MNIIIALTNKDVTHSFGFLVTIVSVAISAVATTVDYVFYSAVSSLTGLNCAKSNKWVTSITTVLVISDNADSDSSMPFVASCNIEPLSSTVWLKGRTDNQIFPSIARDNSWMEFTACEDVVQGFRGVGYWNEMNWIVDFHPNTELLKFCAPISW